MRFLRFFFGIIPLDPIRSLPFFGIDFLRFFMMTSSRNRPIQPVAILLGHLGDPQPLHPAAQILRQRHLEDIAHLRGGPLSHGSKTRRNDSTPTGTPDTHTDTWPAT